MSLCTRRKSNPFIFKRRPQSNSNLSITMMSPPIMRSPRTTKSQPIIMRLKLKSIPATLMLSKIWRKYWLSLPITKKQLDTRNSLRRKLFTLMTNQCRSTPTTRSTMMTIMRHTQNITTHPLSTTRLKPSTMMPPLNIIRNIMMPQLKVMTSTSTRKNTIKPKLKITKLRLSTMMPPLNIIWNITMLLLSIKRS